MRGDERRRGLGAYAAAAAVVGVLVAPAVADAALLKPDVKALEPGAVRLCREMPKVQNVGDACTGTGRTVIRISSKIGNRGRGPLEYRAVSPASDRPRDCHGDGNPDVDGDGNPDDNDVLVRQVIYEDSDHDGVFDRAADSVGKSKVVGCRYYHPLHDHYHVESFARYVLADPRTGKTVRAGNKVSFCIADTDPFDLSLPGAQQPSGGAGYYSDEACDARDSIQGTSVGWFDLYGWGLPGQEIDISGIREGDYCVVTRADPKHRLVEMNPNNNDHAVRVHVDPSNAPTGSYVTLAQKPGRCHS